MSYDIYLKDPVTGEAATVPGHLMIGGTYKVDYHPETGIFTPALNTEAHLNVTYNYGRYYRINVFIMIWMEMKWMIFVQRFSVEKTYLKKKSKL